MIRKHGGLLVSLSALCALVVQPLAGGLVRGDDALFHYFRIPVVQSLWQNGIFYSRWSPDLIFGYGYPLFNFYPPLTAYLSASLDWLLQDNALLALQIAYGLSLAMACVGMFGCGQKLYGTRAGLLVAAAYVLSPHLLYQTYVRTSLSNAWAMALFPWAVWGLLGIIRQNGWNTRRMAISALAIAAIMLSHLSAGVLFVLALIGWGMVGAKRNRLHFVLTIGAGLALSAFFWLPALTEISQTWYDSIVVVAEMDIGLHFADWMWQSPLTIDQWLNGQLPRTVGSWQLLMMGLTLMALLRRGSPLRRASPTWLTIGISGATLLIASAPSRWLWENIGLLERWQWPWRFLDVPTFFGCLAIGWLVREGATKWFTDWLIVIAIILFASNAITYLYPPHTSDLPPATMPAASAFQAETMGIGLTAWGEYTSAVVDDVPTVVPFAGADDGAMLAEKLVAGSFVAETVESSPLSAEINLILPTPQTITFSTLFFPGWQATVDGEQVEVTYNENGQLALPVPAGEHQVHVWFGRTPIRWLADGISAITFLILIAMFFWGKSVKHTTTPTRHPIPLLFPLVTVLLLAGKVLWIDYANNPFVVHASRGIPTTTKPPDGNFDNRIELVGYKTTPPNQLTLFWQALRNVERNYEVKIELADAQGNLQHTEWNEFLGGEITSTWQMGNVTRGNYVLPLDTSVQPNITHLSLSLLDPIDDTPLPLMVDGATQLSLGYIKNPPDVLSPELVEGVELAALATDETLFADAIALIAVDLPSTIGRDQPLTYSLVWESRQAVAENYTVFVHLFDADGNFVAGDDGQPLAGRYPTRYWELGERIVDTRIWSPSVSAGEYEIQVGWYAGATGDRLLITSADSLFPDRIIIGRIIITE